MREKDLLDSLPLKYYLIDIQQKAVVETNDLSVTAGIKVCDLPVFHREDSLESEHNDCFCSLLEKENEFRYVIEAGKRRNRKYYQADVKRAGDNFAMATFTDITHAMRSEKELRINNYRLKRAENLVSFGSWEIDLESETLYATDGACMIYGLNEKILPLSEVMPVHLPEYREMIEQKLKELIGGETTYDVRFRIKRPTDGEIRHIHSVGEYRKDKKMIFGIIRDITELDRYETALKDSLADLKMAQSIAKLGNFRYDPETNDVMISGQVNEIFGGGVNYDNNIKDFEKFAGTENYRLLETLIAKAVGSGIGFENQFQIRLPEGTEKWIEIICRPDSEKGPTGYLLRGTIQDITASKNVELELKNTNNLFRTLVQNIPDAMYMKDRQGRKILANERDVKNCGKEREEEVLGKTDFEIYPEEIARKFYKDDLQVLEHGRPVMNREEELPEEPKRWILTTKIPIKDEQGNVTGLVGIGHDITQRKKMEEELKAAKHKAEESDHLKSVFLANMSHEIRTPLNGILGFSNLICSHVSDSSQLSHYADMIDSCGRRLTTLVDDILDISLIQTNQLKLDMTRFNLSELLQELYAFYKDLKHDRLKHIDFRIKNLMADEPVYFYSDKQRIYQVLKNLLDNAIKFTPSGYIHFGCYYSENGHLNLFVEDSGIGIEKTNHRLIFENFRQVEEGLSRNYEGAGLGLPIVSGIVNQLGGTIKVDSEHGRGSGFYISFPAATEAAGKNNRQISTGFSQVSYQDEVQGKHIVSMEDDPASIEYLKNVAQLLGCNLVNFVNPVHGIEHVRRNRADLILMDVRMPGMSGFEATRIIKSEFPNLPVIIQTAYAMKEDREKAMDSGCDEYLAKPVPLKELRGTIKKFLGERN